MGSSLSNYDCQIEQLSKQTRDVSSYSMVTQELFCDEKINRGRILVWHKYSKYVRNQLTVEQSHVLDDVYLQWWNFLYVKEFGDPEFLLILKQEWIDLIKM